MRLILKSAMALIAALAQASPTSPKPSGTSVLAHFDDLVDSLPGVSLAGTAVGDYKGLNWKALNVNQLSLLGTSPIVPHSPKNVAGHGVVNEMNNGGISITAKSVASFDFISAYIGCQSSTRQTTLGIAEGCTLSFSAYRKGQSAIFKTVIHQFDPKSKLNSEMQLVSFDKAFEGLDRVDVAVLETTALPKLFVSTFLDDVALRTYAK